MRLRHLGTTLLLTLAALAPATAQTAPAPAQPPVEARTATLIEEQVRRDPAATAATGFGVSRREGWGLMALYAAYWGWLGIAAA